MIWQLLNMFEPLGPFSVLGFLLVEEQLIHIENKGNRFRKQVNKKIIHLVTVAFNFFKDCYLKSFYEATEILSPS